MSASIFSPLKNRTLKDDVLDALTEAILTGRLKPGDRLNECRLARELGVSRAPIREALQQFCEQGLAISHPRRGTSVVILDDEDRQKINSLRLVLEAEALLLARIHGTPQGRKKLQQLVEKMESAKPCPALESARTDFQFHRTIWSLTGNEYLDKTLKSLTAPLFAYSVLVKPKPERMRMILDSHRPLLEFVEGRSAESAEEVMFKHLNLRWDRPTRFSSREQPDHEPGL